MEGSVGARLRRAREQRQVSLDEVAEVTRLRLHYLQALENDDLSAMPSVAQARGFLRIYADYLGLQMDELLASPEDSPEPLPPSATAPSSASSDAQPQPRNAVSLSALGRRLPFGKRKAPEPARPPAASQDDAAGDAGQTNQSPTLTPITDSISAEPEPEGLQRSPGSSSTSAESTPDASSQARSPAEAPGEASSPEMGPAGASEQRPEAGALAGATSIGSRLSGLRLRLPFGRRADAPAHEPLPQPPAAARIEPDTRPVPPQGTEQSSEEVTDAPESSDEIFADIGRQLLERRELLGLTEDEVERHSRVKASFVHSLERAAFEDLPSPVQTRGILANYASFLDLDVDATLLRFADGLQARHREQRPEPHAARARPSLTVHTSVPPLRTFIASDLVFGVGVAILLALFAAWGITRVMATRSAAQANATSPSISDVLAGTAISTLAAEVTLIPAQDTPTAATNQVSTPEGTQAATLDPNVTLQLGLATSERTYLRVTVDGEVVFDGRTLPGTEYAYQGADRIELLVGNASALRVTFNGRDLGLLGGFGEVADRIFTAEGMSTPTSTPPPTPTPSPNITATPSLTPTPTSSPTATPSPGG